MCPKVCLSVLLRVVCVCVCSVVCVLREGLDAFFFLHFFQSLFNLGYCGPSEPFYVPAMYVTFPALLSLFVVNGDYVDAGDQGIMFEYEDAMVLTHWIGVRLGRFDHCSHVCALSGGNPGEADSTTARMTLTLVFVRGLLSSSSHVVRTWLDSGYTSRHSWLLGTFCTFSS